MRLINCLTGWDEATGPDEAAELIQVMRDRPAMLRTELGRRAHMNALAKIKGTWWEKTLFPLPVDMETMRTIKAFRESEARQMEAIREREQQAFEKRAEQSQTYISRIKASKAKGQLTSAKDILLSMGFNTQPSAEDGPEGA